MRYDIIRTSQFRKDIRLLMKRGADMQKLKDILNLLQNGEKVPDKNRDHALGGDYVGFRECHIAPDWLLIYAVIEKELVLVLSRSGSHSDLF